MVERNHRNPLRCHWRNQSEQCRVDYQGGRKFHRRVFRGLGAQGRTGIRRATALSTLLSGLILALPAYAQTSSELPSISDGSVMMDMSVDSNFNIAVDAYTLGDYSRALNFATFAADNGLPDAQVMVAHIYLRGLSGIVDHNKAADYYRKAAAQQNSDAFMGLGEMAQRSLAGLTPSDAMTWFSSAAQAGRKDAMRAIGEMYLKGQGVTPDSDKAEFWLAKAAQMGDSQADRKMADSLFETDPVKALEYYEKAAAGGDHEAAYIAALMYEENYEIRPDTTRMTALMRQAAESGHAAAQADYGLLVYQGRGTAPDITGAAKWFEKSAHGGDSEGQFLYAFTLAKGEGVEQSYEDAYYWLLKSGESEVSTYNQDRITLRDRLDQNIDRAIIDRAKARFNAERKG